MTGSTYNTLSLSWTKPKYEKGEQDEAKGYFVEIRPAESTEWNRCNTNAIIMTSYTVKQLKSMALYWVRVIAVNEGGAGEPKELNNYILAMPPPGMSLVGNHLYMLCPYFTDFCLLNITNFQMGKCLKKMLQNPNIVPLILNDVLLIFP